MQVVIDGSSELLFKAVASLSFQQEVRDPNLRPAVVSESMQACFCMLMLWHAPGLETQTALAAAGAAVCAQRRHQLGQHGNHMPS